MCRAGVRGHRACLTFCWTREAQPRAGLVLQDRPPLQAQFDFEPRWFRQPLDHFDKGRSETFLQRYWVSDRHYAPGGPVIVLDGGETSGENRLPFLDTGIVDILARATGGLGVVLEHRYYGRSLPVLNLTTDALRFLNNNQSAADSANFMANVKFDGIEEDLTAPGTPWIYYGVRKPTRALAGIPLKPTVQGSYAGARAAHMRVLYPDLTFGAIASSGALCVVASLSAPDSQCSCHARYGGVLGVPRSHQTARAPGLRRAHPEHDRGSGLHP